MATEALQQGLTGFAELLRLLLEALSVATVLVGLLACLPGIGPGGRRRRSPGSLAAIRIGFGSWLSLALEFQLGADIVATTASPSRDNLIQLAVVAVIRTGLNVFLARELESERRLEAGNAPQEPQR
ncbi:MAG: hypothetical protein RLZZ124_1563 [Cyanobacteriota bacterium]